MSYDPPTHPANHTQALKKKQAEWHSGKIRPEKNRDVQKRKMNAERTVLLLLLSLLFVCRLFLSKTEVLGLFV